MLSNHPSWTLQIPPSPQAGSPTAPCTRRIYSCFLQFLTTISLALIFLSKYDFSNGTVLSSYCQNIKTISMFMKANLSYVSVLLGSQTVYHSSELCIKHITLSFCPTLSEFLFFHTTSVPIITIKRITVFPV